MYRLTLSETGRGFHTREVRLARSACAMARAMNYGKPAKMASVEAAPNGTGRSKEAAETTTHRLCKAGVGVRFSYL